MTFFSGTDIATLGEEGRDRNHFVSLIVNNDGKYTAAITRKVKSTKNIQESYNYKSFEDTVTTGINNYQEEVEFIEYFKLDIIKEGETESFQELDNRLAEIRKRKDTTSIRSSNANYAGPRYPMLEEEGGSSYPSLFTQHKSEDEIVRKSDKSIKGKPYSKSYNISKDDLQHILIQLITGSIIIRDTSKIDVMKWVHSMPKIFGDRFGKDKNGIEKFKEWADLYCEFLICDKEPSGLSAEDETEWITNFAVNLYSELSALPENKYIEILKETIEQWMIQ